MGIPAGGSFWKKISGYIYADKPISSGKARIEKTSNASLTAQECRGTIITNQGASGEVDLTLYPLLEGSTVLFVIEEAQIMEIGPPTGEAFDFDGTTLDANDCIDSPNVVGAKMICTRMKNASGTWVWSCDTVRGVWVDTGPSD